MKKLYELIVNDKEIIDIYNKIHDLENSDEFGYAYHDFNHVLNVANLVKQILEMLDYDGDYIYSARIAAILHDTGALQGKDGHALRSYEFAKDYFKKKNITLENIEQVLEAIKIHSDGFDTDNIIALALILADKLDIKYTRVAEAGKNIVGNRQFLNIIDIEITIENNIFIINFITTPEINVDELNNYYFTKKVFKAIESFCNKVNKDYRILMNKQVWKI